MLASVSPACPGKRRFLLRLGVRVGRLAGLLLLFQQIINLLLQLRQILLHGAPDNIDLHVKVIA